MPLPSAAPGAEPTTEPSTGRTAGLAVLERGWLSSNNVLLFDAEQGATLVDSGHTVHAAQTAALVRHALAAERGQRLARVLNTHLHSDHCGGNATLQREWGCTITTPPGQFEAARQWDTARLSHDDTGQLCEPFTPDAVVQPGTTLRVGRRAWQVLAAPGHDPHSVLLFDATHGVLISADALWENGFGVVFPELDGASGFDEVAQVLDLIERLDARWVVPGHGAPFADVPGALARARSRLAGQRADPARHARHALRVLLKYHLMEVGSEPLPALLDWFGAAPLCLRVWQRLGQPAGSHRAYGERVLAELAGSGALVVQAGVVMDR
jgi:glyoxylase-like metal-dependent hydrolase (beta-lactamase superfamily II)